MESPTSPRLRRTNKKKRPTKINPQATSGKTNNENAHHANHGADFQNALSASSTES